MKAQKNLSPAKTDAKLFVDPGKELFVAPDVRKGGNTLGQFGRDGTDSPSDSRAGGVLFTREFVREETRPEELRGNGPIRPRINPMPRATPST